MLPTGRRSRRTRSTGLPELRTEMDRLLSDFFDQGDGSIRSFAPPTDLYETEDAYVVESELPGFDRDDIEVTLDQGSLTIRGSRSAESERETEEFHLRERATGQFERSFRLPRSIKAENVTARFDQGILRVEVPKAAEARSRKIDVEVG